MKEFDLVNELDLEKNDAADLISTKRKATLENDLQEDKERYEVSSKDGAHGNGLKKVDDKIDIQDCYLDMIEIEKWIHNREQFIHHGYDNINFPLREYSIRGILTGYLENERWSCYSAIEKEIFKVIKKDKNKDANEPNKIIFGIIKTMVLVAILIPEHIKI